MSKRSKQNQPAPTISDVQKVVEQHFPELWPGVEAGLATVATLLLEDNVNPPAVIYLGPPASGKSTVLDMFVGHPLIYRSDKFTPAAFVSHKADVKKKELREKIDLLPRIKHKCLLTREMAPVFAGKDTELRDRLATMTAVLDGKGYTWDSGSQGQRGYEEPHLFAWLGASTPLTQQVWSVMGNMGSRLFFWPMDQKKRPTVDDLVETLRGVPYDEKLEECKKIVHKFLTSLFGPEPEKAVKTVKWNRKGDDPGVLKWIAQLAKLLAILRGGEEEFRALTVLYNFARGLAYIRERQQVTIEDIPRVAQLAIGSVPERLRKGLIAVIRAGGFARTKTIQEAVNCSRDTALEIIDACNGSVMEKGTTQSGGRPSFYLLLQSEWKWAVLLQAVLGGALPGSPVQVFGWLSDPSS